MGKSDRFLKACRQQQVDCTPVWLMRQAGRYLPEYGRIREKYSFLDMCRTPELAVEVTLQPIRRFDLDAAIIFSDILLPLEGMGIGLRFSDGDGPVIDRPLRSKADVEALKPIDPEEALGYVLKAIEMTVRNLDSAVPLIGFSGGPFTLASYLIEGGGSKHYRHTKAMMYTEPETFRLLMEKLTVMAIGYLNAQIRHGARAVQVFDSWVGIVSTTDYREYVLPHMKQLFASLDESAPSIHFGVGAYHLLPLMKEAGGTVMGTDWRVPIDEVRRLLGRDRAIQGNLDPVVLFSPPRNIEARVKDILRRVGRAPGYIFNLGHGVLPGTPVENVKLLIDLVHEHGRNPS